MKKALPWVISSTFLIVYVWLMKTLSLWGLEYIVVFSFFAFVPLMPFLAPFLGILMFFKKKKTIRMPTLKKRKEFKPWNNQRLIITNQYF